MSILYRSVGISAENQEEAWDIDKWPADNKVRDVKVSSPNSVDDARNVDELSITTQVDGGERSRELFEPWNNFGFWGSALDIVKKEIKNEQDTEKKKKTEKLVQKLERGCIACENGFALAEYIDNAFEKIEEIKPADERSSAILESVKQDVGSVKVAASKNVEFLMEGVKDVYTDLRTVETELPPVGKLIDVAIEKSKCLAPAGEEDKEEEEKKEEELPAMIQNRIGFENSSRIESEPGNEPGSEESFSEVNRKLPVPKEKKADVPLTGAKHELIINVVWFFALAFLLMRKLKK